MGRHEIEIWNRTDARIEVKEGNSGIFNLCTPLACNAKHKLRIESDTTYRTFKVLRAGDPMNNTHYVDLDSDYLTDNKVVYIRINEQGKCYKDGISREMRSMTKDIVNHTGETITIKETANLANQIGRLTLLKVLKPGESWKVDVIDQEIKTTGRLLRYSVEMSGGSQSQVCSREITAEDFSSSVVEISIATEDPSLEKQLIIGQRIHEPTLKSFRVWPWPFN